MIAGRQQVLGVERLLRRVAAAEHAHVGRQHAAGDVRHAADHHGEQFGLGHPRDVRAHRQRRFGLADEHAGADAGGFGAGHAHHLGDRQRHDPHDELHHPEVVQHAHQRGEEDDRGQHLEGEDEAELRGVHQAAEDEVRAGADEAEDLHEALAQGVEDLAATGDVAGFADRDAGNEEHERGEGDLQAQAGQHEFPVDRLLVVREQPGNPDQHRQSEQAEADPCQTFHMTLPRPCGPARDPAG
jgi:hypothetical protein